MVEFTGERVVPGEVSDDLWSEHFARYAFARRYATGRRVLDAGCGTGYGAAELAFSAKQVIGLDVSNEALQFAQRNCSIPSLTFVAGSGACLPFRNASFDLLVAFEVIEHLREYRVFIDESARVLTEEGVFLVSSPNKLYYSESRGATGPNPFHEHEFEPREFAEELRRKFPNVLLLAQNRAECFVFHDPKAFPSSETRMDGSSSEETAHFLIGVCSFHALDRQSFVYVPKAANLLREREHHIRLLQDELARNRAWLAETRAERDTLLDMFRNQKQELDERTRWAGKLNDELTTAADRIVHLQEESRTLCEGYEAKVRELEAENQAKTEWALETEARLAGELDQKVNELAQAVSLLDAAEHTVEERTIWAQRVETERQLLAEQLNLIRASRWLKLGRKIGLGPE